MERESFNYLKKIILELEICGKS